MPTREDVDLARAAIDRGFLTIQESVKCLEIQRDHEKAGRHIPLEHIFVEAKFLTSEQLASLKESIARAAALRRIGHFEIISKIGAGGMGTVYKAKDTKTDRVVALKVLSPGHATNPESIVRFLREAHASGRLSHPNVVQGYDAGEADGQFYFAMEFIDGITVAEMLRDGRPIPEQQALDIAIQVAKALEHAEEQHLVHGDIKPDNIMITSDGTAKLADLGLARLAATRPGQRVKTALGTVYYASPEQCQGEAGLDSKADMYSFGATLFHMLAGRVPFDGESGEVIMAHHLRTKPEYLKDINVQLSHGVSKIVRKLMAKDKRDRYPSMSDVVRDLTLVRMGRSPRLGERSRYDSGEYRYRSATGSWRTKTPSRRTRILFVAACLFGAVALLTVGFVLMEAYRPKVELTDTGGIGPPAVASSTPALVTTRPKSAAEMNQRAAEIYLEDILKKRSQTPREALREALLSVPEKYPDTPAAEDAKKEADVILADMEKDARDEFDVRKRDALKHVEGKEYQAALRRLADFPEQYRPTSVANEVAAFREALLGDARSEFERIRTAAAELAKEKKFDEAIAAYQPVIDKFGIAEMKTEAEAVMRALLQAKRDEEKRAAEEARKREHEEKVQKDRLAVRQAAEEVRGLVRQGNLAEAEKKLDSSARKLLLAENRPPLQRAATDLRAFQTLYAALTRSDFFANKELTLTCKDGSKVEGAVFRFDERGLSLTLAGTTTIRRVSWDELSLDTLRELNEARTDGKLTPAERCGIAAVLFFVGREEDAKAELSKLTASPATQKDAELRLADYERFAAREE